MGVCIETLIRTGSDGDTALEIGPGSLESVLPPRAQKGSWSFISAPVCSKNRTGGKCTTMLFSREWKSGKGVSTLNPNLVCKLKKANSKY